MQADLWDGRTVCKAVVHVDGDVEERWWLRNVGVVFGPSINCGLASWGFKGNLEGN